MNSQEKQFMSKGKYLKKISQNQQMMALPLPLKREFSCEKVAQIYNDIVSQMKDVPVLQYETTNDIDFSEDGLIIKIQQNDDFEQCQTLMHRYYLYINQQRIQQGISNQRRKIADKIGSCLASDVQNIPQFRQIISNNDQKKVFSFIYQLSTNIQKSYFDECQQINKKYAQKIKILIRELNNSQNFSLRKKILLKQIDSKRIFELQQIDLIPSQRKHKRQLLKQSYMNQLIVNKKNIVQEQTNSLSNNILPQRPKFHTQYSKSKDQVQQHLMKQLQYVLKSGPNKFSKIISQSLTEDIKQHLSHHFLNLFS